MHKHRTMWGSLIMEINCKEIMLVKYFAAFLAVHISKWLTIKRLLLLFPVSKVMGSYGRSSLKKIQGLYFRKNILAMN